VPVQPSPEVPPLALHDVAPVVDHVAVATPFTWTAAGETLNEVMTGAGGTLSTSTVTDIGELVPPGPLQVSV
jgi:hypothetical protein